MGSTPRYTPTTHVGCCSVFVLLPTGRRRKAVVVKAQWWPRKGDAVILKAIVVWLGINYLLLKKGVSGF